MSQILERVLSKSRLPEATAAFIGFIVGEAAFRFGTDTPELPYDQPLHKIESLLVGTGTALVAAGLVSFIRSRRNNT